MTAELTAFLLACLDEDEQTAQRAAEDGGPAWRLRDHESDPWVITNSRTGDPVVHDGWGPGEGEAAHIARHDPARVLAEVAAKRRIVKWVQDWPLRPHRPSSVDGVLELLALPYADRDGYLDKWRPRDLT